MGCEAFLAKQTLPDPKILSASAREMLTINDKLTEFVFIGLARSQLTFPFCLVQLQF